MDLQIVSIGLSIVAFILSIVVFIDNRRKTKIMNQQLDILQEQAESKKEIRNAMKTVSKVQEIISKISLINYDWGDFGAVAYLRLLENLHDSGKSEITWKTTTSSVFGKFFGASLTKWNRFESFLSFFEKEVTDSKSTLEIEFLSNPKIWANSGSELDNIKVGDYVRTIYSLRIAYDELRSIGKVINLYDSSLPDDIQEVYLKILKALHERLLSGYKLIIKADVKTKDLPEYLLRFIAYDVWMECIKDLNECFVPRLYEIQRHMLEIV